jgi:glycerol kinase
MACGSGHGQCPDAADNDVRIDGEMKCSFGTGSFLLMNIGGKPRLSNNGLLTTAGWNFNGHTAYAFDGGIFVTGSAVQWLRDNLKFIPDSAASHDAANKSTDMGVMVVPTLQGFAAPHWRTDVRGAVDCAVFEECLMVGEQL